MQLRRSLPDIIISDLSMPNMSGFEFLSVVRKRFPQIPVIAISGAYNGGLGGVIADAFFFKGHYGPEELFDKIRSLLEAGPIRPYVPKPDRAPLWVPVNDKGYQSRRKTTRPNFGNWNVRTVAPRSTSSRTDLS